MRRITWFFLAVGLLAFTGMSRAQEPADRSSAPQRLDIYFVDSEGGQITLFVAPSGQSMLVDTGFAGQADRIMAVLKEANVTVLDYVVITHYHGDHVGSAAELANRIPIRHFVDHGDYTVELQPNRSAGFTSYQAVRAKAHAIVPKPGDKIPVTGLDVEVVSAAGEVITKPVAGAPGAGAPNALCHDAKLKDQDPTPENTESLGLVVRYGKFRLLDLGDLVWNLEHALVCPNNLLGTFDVFHTTRHGDPHSGAPQLVHAIRARVAIMNNGEKKGGDPEYWQIVHIAPGLEDFWQEHRSAAGGEEHNSPEQFIANLSETDHLHNIKMSVLSDGSFTVSNERTGFTKEYAAKNVAAPKRQARK